MSYLLHEGIKVKCEITEMTGKQKKMWQTRLGSKTIPNYLAQLVYIGGGRLVDANIHQKFIARAFHFLQ